MAHPTVNAQCRGYGVAKSNMSDKRLIPVRLSHLLRHCSVGAVVRGPEYLLVVRDTREWTDRAGATVGRIIPYVEQVKSAMEIDRDLREPPIASETSKGVKGHCVPADIFPAWMRCLNSRCGALHYKPWRGDDNYRFTCRVCAKGRLEQVPWVMAHEEGHLADVPWHAITHSNASTPEQKNCGRTWDVPYLQLKQNGHGRMDLQCSVCNVVRNFDPRDRLLFDGNRQPWLRIRPEYSEIPAEILSLNDTRLHLAVTQNALVIPPESRVRRGTVVDRLYASSDKLKKIQQAKTNLQKRQQFRQISREFQCAQDEIEAAMVEIDKGYPLYGQQITNGLLLESEYEALTDFIPDLLDDEDFVPRHMTDQWREMGRAQNSNSKLMKIVGLIDLLVAIDRLKEIMVLKGFQRLSRDGALVPPDIEGKTDWLPALELYGEGLFFTLNELFLRQWESQTSFQTRAREVARRYKGSDFSFESEADVSPRFLLLHTLAHMLIKELESQAGYPAASLKERIYCSTILEQPMAGILIYVAVPDVVGSLGGLSEQAKPQRLLNLLSRVFDHAEWCSLDPVCAEHQGQGPGLLNRAACHACALIPEPCCAYANVLLDRIFIRGDRANGLRPILDFAGECVDGKA
ncbi:DrmB family protein [Halomonas tibetensis]|uniref:DrmB family protein n=1 Tax=Halomonas tibetensis TaxID=2259590 RepID=A0ABV7B9K3_9GAMM